MKVYIKFPNEAGRIKETNITDPTDRRLLDGFSTNNELRKSGI